MYLHAESTTIRGNGVAPVAGLAHSTLPRFQRQVEAYGVRERSARSVERVGNDRNSGASVVGARLPPASPANRSTNAREDQASAAGVTNSADASLERLWEEVRGAMVVNPEYARSTALRLVAMLSTPPAGSGAARTGLAPWQLRKVDRYLADNLACPLRLQMLAEQVNLSVGQFIRSFKVSRGVTPHRYIIRLRLEKAQSMMVSTTELLSGIALECGLSDQAHLTTLFRRNVGDTPHAWRRSHFKEAGSGRAVM